MQWCPVRKTSASQAAATCKFQRGRPVAPYDGHRRRTPKQLRLRARPDYQHGMPLGMAFAADVAHTMHRTPSSIRHCASRRRSAKTWTSSPTRRRPRRTSRRSSMHRSRRLRAPSTTTASSPSRSRCRPSRTRPTTASRTSAPSSTSTAPASRAS
jgi:hypothetical protein